MKNELLDLQKKIEKYMIKKIELLELAAGNNDEDLKNILDELSLKKPNILWDLADSSLNNRCLASEIKESWL